MESLGSRRWVESETIPQVAGVGVLHGSHQVSPVRLCWEGVNTATRSHSGPAPFLCNSLAPPGFSSFLNIVTGTGT